MERLGAILDSSALQAVVIAAAVIGAWFAYRSYVLSKDRARRDELCSAIKDPQGRADLIARHAGKGAAAYRAMLAGLLDWADRVWGPPLRFRAFDRCLLFAFVYPVLAALIAWMATEQTAFGGLPLFDEVDAWPERLARGTGLVLILGFIACFFPVGAFGQWILGLARSEKP